MKKKTGCIAAAMALILVLPACSGKSSAVAPSPTSSLTINYSTQALATPQPTIYYIPNATSTPTPTAYAAPEATVGYTPEPAAKGPSAEDIKGCDEDVVLPDDGSWLDDYETKYVKTKHGVRAYLRYGPDENSGYFSYVYEEAEVTVLARQNGYSLVKAEDGVAGWVTSSVLVDNY